MNDLSEDENNRLERACDDACRLISRALGHVAFLQQWQRHNGQEVTRGMASLPIRKAWLERLIRDCEAALER